MESKKVHKTKNAPFYIYSENKPFWLVMVGDNLPQIIRHQPMIIIIINIYIVQKKRYLFSYMCMLNDIKIYKKREVHE